MRSKWIVMFLVALWIQALVAAPCAAKFFRIGDKPANITGYISQSAQMSIEGEHYDVQEGVNSLLTNLFVEGDVRLTDDLMFYSAGMVSVDWIYDVKSNDTSWNAKRFNESRDTVYIDDEWWQVLKEAHFTWTPGAFTVRAGKQQVRWGEMEAFAVNDLINPTDETRGLTSVELETLQVAIPLVKVQHDTEASFGWFNTLSTQFVFNPNVDHIPSTSNYYGNDRAGVWAPDLVDPDYIFGFFPGLRYGRQDVVIENEPDAFDDDFFEYGLRFSTLLPDNSLFSVMGFYGRANSAATTAGEDLTLNSWLGLNPVDTDGNYIVDLLDSGFYPRQKFVGAAWAGDLPIQIGALGGSTPVLRAEVSYRFDETFFDNAYLNTFNPLLGWYTGTRFVESDVLVTGLNLEYKIRLPWQRGFLSVVGEAVHSKILDYEDDWDLDYEEEWFDYYVYAFTTYLNGRLTVGLDWYAADNAGVQILTPNVSYAVNERMNLGAKVNLFYGDDLETWGLQNKDNAVASMTYTF